MKKLEIIIIIAVVSIYVCACSSEYNDGYQDSPVIDETSIEDTSALDYMEEMGNLSIPIDYNFLEERYGVYRENICADPQSVYGNTVIMDLIKFDLDYEKYMKSKIPEIPNEDHDYFVFDFNGDGLDDYLICFHGILYSGSGGNLICIYVQEDDGEFIMRFHVTAEIFVGDPHKHEAIAVLNSRVEGYYSLVLPWTENRVWSFDSDKGWYDS